MISTIATPEPVTALTLADVPLWRMSVEAYLGRIQRGTFTSEDRLELLEGMVVAKMTKNQPHVSPPRQWLRSN